MYLNIYILKHGIFRIRERTNSEGFNRFYVHNIDDPINLKALVNYKDVKMTQTETNLNIYYFAKLSKNEHYIEIDDTVRNKYELRVEYNPFKIVYLVNNKQILSINENNLLNVETPQPENLSETEAMSTVKVDVKYHDTPDLYGLPLRAGDILLMDTPENEAYRIFNVDKFKYERDDLAGLYGSLPIILATSPMYTGFIWNNPSETYVVIKTNDKDKNVLWLSESGIIDFTFFSASGIHNYYEVFNKLLGPTPLPPIFSLGYHQSRWNYKSTQDLIQVDKNFDFHDIPYDTIWLDIEVN